MATPPSTPARPRPDPRRSQAPPPARPQPRRGPHPRSPPPSRPVVPFARPTPLRLQTSAPARAEFPTRRGGAVAGSQTLPEPCPPGSPQPSVPVSPSRNRLGLVPAELRRSAGTPPAPSPAAGRGAGRLRGPLRTSLAPTWLVTHHLPGVFIPTLCSFWSVAWGWGRPAPQRRSRAGVSLKRTYFPPFKQAWFGIHLLRGVVGLLGQGQSLWEVLEEQGEVQAEWDQTRGQEIGLPLVA